jgi:outer membrane receptor protein involved in Fe transport
MNGDGAISQDELASGLVYASTAGNPHGAVNYDRLYQSALGAQQTRANGLSLFLQDTFNATDRLSFNVGVRSERFAHIATDGTNIFTFDWTLAPRLSVSYDPTGNGRQRISASTASTTIRSATT